MKKVNFQPLGPRVLIKPDEVKEKTASGLYIPEEARKKEKPLQGVVVALGSEPMVLEKIGNDQNIEVGDKVQWQRFRGAEVRINGIDYWCVEAEELHGIFK